MRYLLRLFITGRSGHSIRAVNNLTKLCESELKDRYELEVIDVLEHPQIAEGEKVLATPTVIRKLPPPVRKIIGDLSDRDRVLAGLDLLPESELAAHKEQTL